MAPKAAAEPQVLVALTSFIGAIGQTVIDVRKGQTIHSTHPAAAKWPEMFAPLSVDFPDHGRRWNVEPTIEQATAAPGEKRGA